MKAETSKDCPVMGKVYNLIGIILLILLAAGCGTPESSSPSLAAASNQIEAKDIPLGPPQFLSPHLKPTRPVLDVLVEDRATYLVPEPIFPRSCGDLWPMAWADDGNVYTANGDGIGFGLVWADMVVSRIEGKMPNLKGHPIPWAWGRHLGRRWPPQAWLVTEKPTGMICVDGVLYLFYQNLKNFLSDSEFGDAPAASISWSDDYGQTWHWDNSGPMFDDHIFTTGMFLDFGKCNQWAFDDYVYIYGLDYNWRYSADYRSTKMYLARVPRDKIVHREAWEFFTGLSSGKPTWSTDIDQKVPVLQDETDYAGNTGVSQGSVIYLSSINRYLYSTWSDTAWIFHDAPKPWGPWRRSAVIEWWHQGHSEERFSGYATVIPTKYLDEDGRGGWLVSSLLGALNNDYYRLAMRRFELVTQ